MDKVSGFFQNSANTWIIVVGLFVVILVVSLVSRLISNSSKVSSSTQTQIKRLIQTAQESHAQALQDKDLLQALMHSNYALVSAKLAREIGDDKTIREKCDVDVNDLISKYTQTQETMVAMLRPVKT